jgi:hypothetical protein
MEILRIVVLLEKENDFFFQIFQIVDKNKKMWSV